MGCNCGGKKAGRKVPQQPTSMRSLNSRSSSPPAQKKVRAMSESSEEKKISGAAGMDKHKREILRKRRNMILQQLGRL